MSEKNNKIIEDIIEFVHLKVGTLSDSDYIEVLEEINCYLDDTITVKKEQIVIEKLMEGENGKIY